MWVNQTPPITIINEGPDWWTTVLASALPALAALVVVGIEGRRWRRQLATELERERGRSAEQLRADRESFWRERRQGAYAALLVALSRVEWVGGEVAVWVRRHPDETTAWGEGTTDKPDAVRPWFDAADELRRTVLNVALVAPPGPRGAAIAALTLVGTHPPTANPYNWLFKPTTENSGPIILEVVRLRQEFERIARQDLGVDQRPAAPDEVETSS